MSKPSRNIIIRASRLKRRNNAIRLIAEALELSSVNRADDILGDQYRWQQTEEWARINRLGEWIRAECVALIKMEYARTPMETVGTND